MTPVCPACGAKFQHDNATARCKACGLPDEVAARGSRAVRAWQIALGHRKARAGSIQARKRAHGRPRGAPRRA